MGGEPGGLDRPLARLERLGEPALVLERVAAREQHRHEHAALAGGARDRDAAVGVRDRGVVVLEVAPGPAEVVERLQPRRELGVRQPVDVLDRLARGGSRAGAVTPSTASASASADAAAAISTRRPAAASSPAPTRRRARGRSRTCRSRPPPARSASAAAPAPVRSGSSFQATRQPPVGVLVAPDPVLDGGAARGQLHAARDASAGAARSPRAGSRGRRRARRASAAPTRARRARRRAARRRPPAAAAAPRANQRAAASGARGAVAAPASSSRAIACSSPRLADCSTWWARSAGPAPRAASASAARAWAAMPRPARRRLVDRPAHERVAEDEAARHLGRADEVEPEQVVERRQPRRRASSRPIAAARSGSNGSPAIAAASRNARDVAARATPAPPPATRPPPAARRCRAPRRSRRRARRPARAPELLEVERVAAAVPVDGGHGRAVAAEQPRRVGLVQRPEPDPPHLRRRECGGEPVGGAPGAEGEREQQRQAAPRRITEAISSTEAPSHQCRSSSTSTSGGSR